MAFNPTDEQQNILDLIPTQGAMPVHELIKVDSCAGSGKTSLLVAIAEKNKPKNGLYLAYNKSIAIESQTKFSSNIHCKTTHALAYANIIVPLKLKVGFFNYKSIKDHIKYEEKLIIIDLVNKFSLSKFISFQDFTEDYKKDNKEIQENYFTLAKKYFNLMASGKINITHAAYLKMYHLFLQSGKTTHKPFDMIMLDEAGDINPVTLEIFKLLPSPLKIMVGDNRQNIYLFNGTINGFKALKNDGIEMHMTKTFRCDPSIATKIEKFCQKHMDPSMGFVGTDQNLSDIKTQGYIARNNSTLIGRMIELNQMNIPYNLTRPAKTMFELINILMYIKPYGKVHSEQYKYIQEEYNDWYEDGDLRSIYQSFRKYLSAEFDDDVNLMSAVGILQNNTYEDIKSAYEYALAHEKEKSHSVTLGTAHSMKGMEMDSITIAPDFKRVFDKITSKKEPSEYNDHDIQELNLLYVAFSRSLKRLLGAEWAFKD